MRIKKNWEWLKRLEELDKEYNGVVFEALIVLSSVVLLMIIIICCWLF